MSAGGDRLLRCEPFERAAFAPFGDVLEARGESFPINAGRCDRFHDQARLSFLGEGAQAIVSVARSRPIAMPYAVAMMERHPLGSQIFAPLGPDPFLVVVAPDEDGAPGRPRAFLTAPGQGVNYLINTWHGVLTPLGREADFLVVDRGGPDAASNLQEHFFEEPYLIETV